MTLQAKMTVNYTLQFRKLFEEIGDALSPEASWPLSEEYAHGNNRHRLAPFVTGANRHAAGLN